MKIKVLSFFTGGGLLDIGFEKAGFDIVWGNEFNPQFAEFFHAGYSSWRISENLEPVDHYIETKSIENLRTIDILSRAFPGTVPDFFGMIGGPPCPDFSNGGLHRGSEGDRGKLSRTFIDLVCELKPTFFVMENVSGLLNIKKHRAYLSELENKLIKFGYCIEKKVLNALEFGVPQHRERLFLVGIQKQILQTIFNHDFTENNESWFPWPSPKFELASTKYEWPRITPFGSVPDKPSQVPDELCIMSCLVPHEQISCIANASNYFNSYSNKFYEIDEGDTRRKSFKRLHRYRYSPTACYGNNEVHLHPFEPRRLSLREVMRIQGLPEGYALPEDCSLTSSFKMISNGVPVPLAYNVAKSFVDILECIYN
jgi:DNA (cytosine-5)-methyltransferase 1